MTMRRGSVAAIAVALLSGLLAGCTAPPVVAGSHVTVAVADGFTSLNPSTIAGAASPTNADVAQLTSTGFGYRDESGDFVLDPSFGHAEVVARDPLTVRYTIDSGARWSDGVAVDATDLALSWLAGSGAVPDAGFESAVPGVLREATQRPQLTADGRTIFLHFDSAVSDWQSALAPTLPAHVVAARALGLSIDDDKGVAAAKAALAEAIERGDTKALAAIARVWNTDYAVTGTPTDERLLVAAGPYVVDEIAGESVTLVANPEYRGDRQPRVETIEVRTVADPAEAARQLSDGTVDIVAGVRDRLAADALRAVPEAKVVATPGGELEQLQLQLAESRSGAFDDPLVRQAFLLTVPRQAIVEAVVAPLAPDAEPLDSFLVSPASGSYSDVVASNGSAHYGEVDLEGARALLAQAGDPDPSVCVLYDPANPARVSEFELISESAELAGFRVSDCSTEDWRRMLGRGGAYDAALVSWSPAGSGAIDALLRSDSTVANLNRLDDPAVDALLDELAAADDPDDRAALVAELDAKLWSAPVGIPLFAHPVATAVGADVTGVTASAFDGSVFWNAWQWQSAPHTPR